MREKEITTSHKDDDKATDIKTLLSMTCTATIGALAAHVACTEAAMAGTAAALLAAMLLQQYQAKRCISRHAASSPVTAPAHQSCALSPAPQTPSHQRADTSPGVCPPANFAWSDIVDIMAGINMPTCCVHG